MTERKPQDQDRYIVRFPDGMRERLKESAEMMSRSLNAEIVWRLEKTFEVGLAHFDVPAYLKEYKEEKDAEIQARLDAIEVERSALKEALDEIRHYRDELRDITSELKSTLGSQAAKLDKSK